MFQLSYLPPERENEDEASSCSTLASQQPPHLTALLLGNHEPAPLSPLLVSNHEPTPLSPLMVSNHEPPPLSPLLLSNHKPAPLSPLLLSSQDEWPPTKATAVFFPAVGRSRVVPKNSENVLPYKSVAAPGASPYCFIGKLTRGAAEQQQQQQEFPPQRPHTPFGAPSL